MGDIALTASYPVSYTLVPNRFIDQYMAYANGEYVKVFLYLLRCMGSGAGSITTSSIADYLNLMESDVMRAFTYWEKQHILMLSRNSGGSLNGIRLCFPEDAGAGSESFTATTAETPSQTFTAATAETPPQPSTAAAAETMSYTDINLSEVTITDEISELLMTLEMYMGRMMKPADTQLICFLYDNLGFSTELIERLYDYCISKNKKRPSYIEAVALAWAKDGIDTVEKADLSIAEFNTSYKAVSKAFALKRAVAPAEQNYIDKWVSQWGFSEMMLQEACSRALLNTGKPDFKYTDRILENWHNAGIKTLDAIQAADRSYNKKQAASSKQQPQQARFRSFSQRDYTEEEYLEMEKKLLNKQ